VISIVTATGVGSGVVVAPGVAVTNRHVVGAGPWVAQAAHVKTEKGAHVATVLKASRTVDLALLRVPDELPPLRLDDCRASKLGETVYVLGNPWGMVDGAITRGIVGKTEHLHTDGISYIQFSATIYGGNSGGAVISDDGTLLGITTMGLSTGEPGSRMAGVGFAVPADQVLQLCGALSEADAADGLVCVSCGELGHAEAYCKTCGARIPELDLSLLPPLPEETDRMSRQGSGEADGGLVEGEKQGLCEVCGAEQKSSAEYCGMCGSQTIGEVT